MATCSADSPQSAKKSLSMCRTHASYTAPECWEAGPSSSGVCASDSLYASSGETGMKRDDVDWDKVGFPCTVHLPDEQELYSRRERRERRRQKKKRSADSGVDIPTGGDESSGELCRSMPAAHRYPPSPPRSAATDHYGSSKPPPPNKTVYDILDSPRPSHSELTGATPSTGSGPAHGTLSQHASASSPAVISSSVTATGGASAVKSGGVRSTFRNLAKPSFGAKLFFSSSGSATDALGTPTADHTGDHRKPAS